MGDGTRCPEGFGVTHSYYVQENIISNSIQFVCSVGVKEVV